MQRIATAIRAMWLILVGAVPVDSIQQVLQADRTPSQQLLQSERLPDKQQAARSDAITLLATLQREARFVDLVQEQLEHYDDAQVGAAARDVLRDCREAIDRMFQLQPVLDQDEGSEVATPEKVDAGLWQLAGNISGNPPFRGKLIHHGWRAQHVDLPVWSGSRDSMHVVAPAEIEVS